MQQYEEFLQFFLVYVLLIVVPGNGKEVGRTVFNDGILLPRHMLLSLNLQTSLVLVQETS